MDLCLGAIDATNINKIKRGTKEIIRKAPKQFTVVRICKKTYKCMENA